MTIQPIETDTHIDIATLVGELPAPPCESRGHDTLSDSDVHDGDATHYVHVRCPACGHDAVKAYCGPFMKYIVHVGVIRCAECEVAYDVRQHWAILGPVNA